MSIYVICPIRYSVSLSAVSLGSAALDLWWCRQRLLVSLIPLVMPGLCGHYPLILRTRSKLLDIEVQRLFFIKDLRVIPLV